MFVAQMLQFLAHTVAEPSARVNSMNQHFWAQNIKI